MPRRFFSRYTEGGVKKEVMRERCLVIYSLNGFFVEYYGRHP